jgi:hypothetical protein
MARYHKILNQYLSDRFGEKKIDEQWFYKSNWKKNNLN